MQHNRCFFVIKGVFIGADLGGTKSYLSTFSGAEVTVTRSTFTLAKQR